MQNHAMERGAAESGGGGGGEKKAPQLGSREYTGLVFVTHTHTHIYFYTPTHTDFKQHDLCVCEVGAAQLARETFAKFVSPTYLRLVILRECFKNVENTLDEIFVVSKQSSIETSRARIISFREVG